MKINGKEIKGKVVLAPMAGITSSGYRKYYEKFGVSFCYTEMVSDMGLIYDNEETKSYIFFQKGNCPVGVQLFGSEPENLAKAAKIVQKAVPFIDFIDVNMACPVPKVTKTGAGSALLKDPKKCGEIIRRIKIETSLEVSAKIRLGWDDKSYSYLEVIKELEKAGVSFIALHARTRKDLYAGSPRFELIKNLRKSMSVPLIISGNIYTPEDAKNALEITGADMVMLARGGIGNPRLVKDINAYLETGIKNDSPSFKEQEQYCLELAQELIKEKGEEKAMRIYRSIAPKFFSGFPNAKELKTALAVNLTTYQSLVSIINEYKANLIRNN